MAFGQINLSLLENYLCKCYFWSEASAILSSAKANTSMALEKTLDDLMK